MTKHKHAEVNEYVALDNADQEDDMSKAYDAEVERLNACRANGGMGIDEYEAALERAKSLVLTKAQKAAKRKAEESEPASDETWTGGHGESGDEPA